MNFTNVRNLSLVILAGGKGTRLKKIIGNKQKCIVPINKKPFLDYILNAYSKYHFDKIYILVGKDSRNVIKLYHNKEINFIKIICLKEKKLLGTAGALYKLRNKLNNFILTNGDSLLDINLKKFFLKDKKFICKMSLLKNINYSSNKKLSNLFVKNNVVHFKKNSKFMNGGVYLFNRRIFNYIKNKKMSLEDDVLPDLIKTKKVTGEIFKEHFFLDIGTKKNLAKSEKIFKEHFYKPAAFLDRDGVINYDYGYIKSFKNFKFRERVIDGLKFLQKKGYHIFIITNQAGIAKGKISINQFKNLHLKLKNYLANKDIFIDCVMYCPHHKDALIKKYKKNCKSRKPENGMIIKILKSRDVNLRKSFFIGDQITDKICAKKSDLRFFYANENFYYQIKKIHNITVK